MLRLGTDISRLAWNCEFARRVLFRMSVLYPESRRRIRTEAVRLIKKRILISLGIFGFLILFDQSVYWIILSIVLIVAVNNVYEASVYARLDTMLLRQFGEFIDELIFRYRCCASIEEALGDTIANAKAEMSLHGSFIYELLTKDDYEATLEYYKTVAPNPLFLMFYSICHMVKNQGDKETSAGSVFISNLVRLAKDIDNELNSKQKLHNAFSGLFGVTIIPLFAIKPMEIWAVHNIEGLSEYYSSAGGLAGTVVVAISSITVYIFIKKMKYPIVLIPVRSELLHRLTYGRNSSGIYARMVAQFQNYFMQRNYGRYRRLSIMLRQTCSELNIREFKVKQAVYALAVALSAVIMLISLEVNAWIVAVAAIVTAVAGYYLPLLSLAFVRILSEQNINGEVVRLQATIQICMYQDGMDVQGLLSHMESVALYYRDIIGRALDRYDGDGSEALEELKMSAYSQSFQRIIDGLIACDALSVEEAFDGIEREREFDIRRNEIREEKMLSDKRAIAGFAAFIPMMLAIVLKLILPFVMEGMNSLVTFSSDFQF